MKLVQVRECDGACCKEAPRFPNADGSDCIYNTGKGKDGGCQLMEDPSLIPDGSCPVLSKYTAQEALKETCIDWPQNMPGRGTRGCCWQWVDK